MPRPPLPPELAEIASEDLRLRVFTFALRLTHKTALADDYTNTAYRLLLEAIAAGAPPPRDLYQYLCWQVHGAVSNDRRLHYVRRRVHPRLPPATSENMGQRERVDPVDTAPAQTPEADELLLEKEAADLCARRYAALRVALAGDRIALAVLDQTDAGEDDCDAQARAIGVSVEEVYNANKRIARAGAKVAKEIRE